MSGSETGQLVIISGPSGVGKSTVMRELLSTCELPLELSVSATTRPPRQGEQDGVDYFFLTEEAFREKIRSDEFLEQAEVFGIGHLYGTLATPVYQSLKAGRTVILEIDVQGAMTVMKKHPEVKSIFISPGSLAELEKRLRGRETESEDHIKQRLSVAADEMDLISHYQHVIKNENIESTATAICELLTKTGEKKPCTRN